MNGTYIGVDVVRALYGAAGDLPNPNVAMMLATTSSFTAGARKYAASKYNFELHDYQRVPEWVNAYRPHPGGRLYISDSNAIILA
jgi:hypothetical protein